MAQVQAETRDTDPATQSFVVDRQAFWGRFTKFTTWAGGVIVVVLLMLWWFVA